MTPSEVICENGGIVVLTRDEKTAPPMNARLQKEHCSQCESVSAVSEKVTYKADPLLSRGMKIKKIKEKIDKN